MDIWLIKKILNIFALPKSANIGKNWKWFDGNKKR